MLKILLILFASVSVSFSQGLAWLSTATKPSTISWSPLDEASLVSWWKADVGATNTSGNLASDGETIKGWKDNGTHVNHATNLQANTTLPKYIANAQNGLPCIRFDGSNDELRADDVYTTYVSGNDTPMIWAMTFRNAKDAAAGIWFCGKNWGGSGYFVRAEIDGSNQLYCTRNSAGTEKSVFVNWSVDTNNWHTVVWKCTGTTAEWFYDGTSQGAPQDVDVNDLTSSNDSFYIGTDFNVFLGADIGEICVFNSTSVSPTNIYNYLKGRWNTP